MSRISYFIAFILFHQVLTQVLGSKLRRAKNSTGSPDMNAGTLPYLSPTGGSLVRAFCAITFNRG